MSAVQCHTYSHLLFFASHYTTLVSLSLALHIVSWFICLNFNVFIFKYYVFYTYISSDLFLFHVAGNAYTLILICTVCELGSSPPRN